MMSTTRPLVDTPERLELAACLAPGEVHTLELLAGQGLLVYQGEAVSAYSGPAEVAVDSLLARINRLGVAASRRLVVWRQEPFDMDFEFRLRSFDYLPVTVKLALSLAIIGEEDFVRRFLATHEVVATAALRSYLYNALSQTLGEDLRGRSLSDLVQDGQLRHRLRTLLRSDLEKRLGGAGLQLIDVHLVAFSHPGYDQARQQQAEIQLALENEKGRLNAQAGLDQLYDEAEKARIRNLELQSQRELREREHRLSQQEQGLLHRERELHILARIEAANTQQEALKHISANELAAVQHKFLGTRLVREMEVDEWQHQRKLASLAQEQEFQRRKIGFNREMELGDAEHREAIRNGERDGKRKDQELLHDHLTWLVEQDMRLDRSSRGNDGSG